MRYFKDRDDFEENMKSFKAILEKKGCVLELDHVYAHEMQNKDAFEDVKDWLLDHGYEGEVHSEGFGKGGIDTYGLYDSTLFSLEEMIKKLSDEIDAENLIDIDN